MMIKTKTKKPASKAKAPAISISKRLIDAVLEAITASENPGNNDQNASLIYCIFAWQEIQHVAKASLKAGWASLAHRGLVADDDKLREDTGESIIAESRDFSVIATVGQAPKRFDLDTFIAKIAKRYKIDAANLHALAAVSKIDGTSPLTKRIIELKQSCQSG